MKVKLLNELNNNGLKIYKFKKNYNELQVIKKNILEKYKNEIDWIEIENIGTKYIVRYEPRLNNNETKDNTLRHIIAKKSAIIYSLDVSSGQIIKLKNSYVKKGDIIVSGYISLNDNIKDTVSSRGIVYGEVWYEVTVTYPLKYKEKIKTGKNKNVFVLKLLNKEIEIFNLKHYKNKEVKKNIILKNNLLPFSLESQYQEELKIKDEDNTIDEAIKKGIDEATKKIENNLGDKEFILNKKVIGSFNDENSVTVKIFYSVIEDITDYQEIEEFKEIINILFIIYIVILYYLVSMPIYRFKVINLIPFKEIFRYKILSKLFIKNTIGNMLLFIPYSLYLTYTFKIKKLYIILISSSILIITIEIIQINIGRVFDIDDIILNIISSILGYLLSKICIK